MTTATTTTAVPSYSRKMMVPEDSDSEDDELLNFRAFAPKPKATPSPINGPTKMSGIGADTSAVTAADDDDDKALKSLPKSVSPSQHEHQEAEEEGEEEEGAKEPTKVPEQDETCNPREIALQRLEKENWNVPDMIMKIVHPHHLLWWVDQVRFGASKQKRGKPAAKKFEVYPCRLANDQELYLWQNELGDTTGKVIVQFIGIHHKYKNQYDAVPSSKLIRFDGVKQLPNEEDVNNSSNVEDLESLRLSEEHLEHYRLTLQRILKLTSVEQWMEVIMMERLMQSIVDRVASKRRAELTVATKCADGEDDDDSAAQFIASVLQRTPKGGGGGRVEGSGGKDGDDDDGDYVVEGDGPLRVGDVIYYYPPELMAVGANLVGPVAIKGINNTDTFRVALENGRGLHQNVRIIRVQRMHQGQLQDVEETYVCEIEAYDLIEGGSMDISGFGSMQKEANALLEAQNKIKIDLEARFGVGSADGMFHSRRRRKGQCQDDVGESPMESRGESQSQSDVTNNHGSEGANTKEASGNKDGNAKTSSDEVVGVVSEIKGASDRSTHCDDVDKKPSGTKGYTDEAEQSTNATATHFVDKEGPSRNPKKLDVANLTAKGAKVSSIDGKQRKPKALTPGKTSASSIVTPLSSANAAAPASKQPNQCQRIISGTIPRTKVAEARRRQEQQERSAMAKEPAAPEQRGKRRRSGALGEDCKMSNSARKSKSRRTTADEPQSTTNQALLQTQVAPRRTQHVEQSSMTQEQMNLADEIMDVMNRRWGDEGTIAKGLETVEKELSLTGYQQRFLHFLTKKDNESKIMEETEGYFRKWLAKQRSGTEEDDDDSKAEYIEEGDISI